jgi:two-component system sensor histidine kinase KdpD
MRPKSIRARSALRRSERESRLPALADRLALPGGASLWLLALCAPWGVLIAALSGSTLIGALASALPAGVLAGTTTFRGLRSWRGRVREADLVLAMARLLLREQGLGEALAILGARLAEAFGLRSVKITLASEVGDERHEAIALFDGKRNVGTLLIHQSAPTAVRRALQARIIPALEALLGAALQREELYAEALQSAALRRADAVKTAVLQSVSHDLRSPLTAIAAAGEALAGEALAGEALSARGRAELTAVVREESARLTRLVENLLDLSRLQAGATSPRSDWTSVEEVIRSAIDDLGGEDFFTLAIDPELPLVRADAMQLERALVNVLENARTHSQAAPVLVRGRAAKLDGRIEDPDVVIVRVVDQGPGIGEADRERIFEPFYRAASSSGRRGSGLGLAIARGFVEANGGMLYADSLPGQGAVFIFELPLGGASAPVPARSLPTRTGESPNGRVQPLAASA